MGLSYSWGKRRWRTTKQAFKHRYKQDGHKTEPPMAPEPEEFAADSHPSLADSHRVHADDARREFRRRESHPSTH